MDSFFKIVPPNFLIVLIAMAVGYLVKRTGRVRPASARTIMVFIQKTLMPCVLVISLWGLELKAGAVIGLPLTGAAMIVPQTALALGAAKVLKLDRVRRGVFLIAAALSNIGYLGWTINYSLFGKPGFDIAFMYGFYFTFAVYLVAYPIAAHCSPDPAIRDRPFLGRLMVEGILAVATAGVVLGVALNLAGVPRPAFLPRFNAALVLVATTGMMFAAGLTVSVRSFRNHATPSVVMAFIKSVLSPLAAAAVLSVFAAPMGLDPLMMRVIIVESMMPMAISCLTVSTIFRLDQDMTNAMWVVSTLCFFLLFQSALVALHIS